jgi:hypothetical protein
MPDLTPPRALSEFRLRHSGRSRRGAALAETVAGVWLLWLAVLAGWLWLAASSAHLYTVVPHPVLALPTDRAA